MSSHATARVTPVGVGVILLTLATAAVHAYLATMALPAQTGVLFLINAVVYVVLLAAAYGPMPALDRLRPTARVLLLLWAVATIIAWAVMGARGTTLAYIDKVIEAALVVLLAIDLRRR